jgi:glutamate dehydrogenase/leucine dehydrogenase
VRGRVSTGAKEDEASTGCVRAVGFHNVTACSRLARVLKLVNRLFNFPLGGGGGVVRGEPRMRNP